MNNQDLKRYEKQREDTRRKPKEYQKKKVAKTTSDPSNQFRRQRSKDDSNIPKRQLSYGSPAHKSQPFRGEFPLTRDFTRGRMKAWCRLDCFERQYHVASFFLHQSVITIDGSNLVDESARIGLGYIPSKTQDPKVTKVKNCIGKGVKLHQDDGGNMWATRMGKNPIYLRGFFLSPELIKLNGKLTQGVPMKVFDVQDFKKNLLQECSRESLSEDDKNKIMGTCKICVSFIKDTMVDEETPCWVEVWLVEHIDTVRRKFMDVERLRRKKLSAEKRLPRGSTPRFENVSNARYELKAKDTIPEEPSEKRVPLTEVPPQTAIPKKVVSPPPPLDLSQNDELPLAENEIRLVMRSPHIRVSGEKDYKDYGGNLPYMSRDQYMAEQQQQPLSDYQRQFVVQEQEPSLSEYAHPLFSQEAQYFPMGNEEERVPQYGKSEGLSYGRVFGMQAFDYAFDFVPPKYTRHRRHSDSDSESVRNFMEANMPIHGILELEEKKPMATPLQWISKKTRRKSEDQKRKGLPPR